MFWEFDRKLQGLYKKMSDFHTKVNILMNKPSSPLPNLVDPANESKPRAAAMLGRPADLHLSVRHHFQRSRAMFLDRLACKSQATGAHTKATDAAPVEQSTAWDTRRGTTTKVSLLVSSTNGSRWHYLAGKTRLCVCFIDILTHSCRWTVSIFIQSRLGLSRLVTYFLCVFFPFCLFSYRCLLRAYRTTCQPYRNVSSPAISRHRSIQPKLIHTNAIPWTVIERIVRISPMSLTRTSIRLISATNTAPDDCIDTTTTIRLAAWALKQAELFSWRKFSVAISFWWSNRITLILMIETGKQFWW